MILLLRIFSLHVLFLLGLLMGISMPSIAQLGGPGGTGQWSGVIQTPIVPAAAANLPNGKVLLWSAYDRFRFGGNRGRTYTVVFDPATNSSQELLISNTQHDMFCPGTSTLADGRIIVTGGSSSNKTSIYDPFIEQWTSAANMNIPRGYHAMVTLGDGKVFTIGGSWSGGRGNKHAEIYDKGIWSRLTGLPVSIILDGATSPVGDYVNDNHAWLWPAPNGKIFHAGPSINMHWIDPQGNGSFTNAGARGNDDFAYSGITVMYDVGKILKAGGANRHDSGTTTGTGNSYIIDINSNQAQVKQVQSLKFPRTKHNAVVLPTGEVMVMGGTTRDIVFNDTGSQLVPELWNPDTEQWRSLAAMQTPRNYHSVAILLPDGRVMAGGGGLCGTCTANHPDVEIFSPPYLFDNNGNLASRPVINNAVQLATTNTTETLSTSTPISYFSLVRYNNVTHSLNNEQRRIELTTRSLGNMQYEIDIPDPNIAIPGYYMLFAVDANGTPSVAHVMQVQVPQPLRPKPGGVDHALKLWLKADEGVTGTTAVSLWEDASGLEFNAVQNTVASQPSKESASMNFNPALDFDGGDDRLQTPLSINHGTLPKTSIVAVYEADNANAGSVWGEDNYGWDRFLVDDKGNRAAINLMVSDGQGGNNNIPGLFSVNKPVLSTVIYDQATPNGSSVHVNGANVRNFTSNQAGGSSPMQVGDDGNGLQPFDGTISEVIVFGEIITETEREKVQSYLGIKYGLHLDHNYYASDYTGSGTGTQGSPLWDKAANASYHNQIAGIGRDDKSGLDQRQSKSEEGGLIEIFHGTFATSFPLSNEDNTHTFLSDKSFMLMGNNGASINSLATPILGGTQQALSRVWKVEETGTIGNVSLRILKSSLPAGVTFLYAHPTDISFPDNLSTQRIALSDDGGLYVTAELNFPGDSYFTLGDGIVYPDYSFNLKAYLQGPFDSNSGLMSDNYRQDDLLPSTDPYELGRVLNPSRLGDQGSSSLLDWVKIELRDANDPSLIVAHTAALITRDGEIVDEDANANITFKNLSSSSFYVCLRHYNHLGVMTGQPIDLSTNPSIDFRNPSTAVYSIGGQALFNEGGRMLMWAGDANKDGKINAIDLNLFWRLQNGQTFIYGTSNADFDLSGTVNSLDVNFYWRINNSLVEQIP